MFFRPLVCSYKGFDGGRLIGKGKRVKRAIGLAILLLAVISVGCGFSPKKLARLELGMSKKEVTKTLGSPYAVKGAEKNEKGQTIECWEYHQEHLVKMDDRDAPKYYLIFCDDELQQWGESEPDDIKEIRFR